MKKVVRCVVPISEIAISDCCHDKWYGRKESQEIYILARNMDRGGFVWIHMNKGSYGIMSPTRTLYLSLAADGEIFQFDSLPELCCWLDEVS